MCPACEARPWHGDLCCKFLSSKNERASKEPMANLKDGNYSKFIFSLQKQSVLSPRMTGTVAVDAPAELSERWTLLSGKIGETHAAITQHFCVHGLGAIVVHSWNDLLMPIAIGITILAEDDNEVVSLFAHSLGCRSATVGAGTLKRTGERV